MSGMEVERPLILVAVDGTPSSLRAGSYAAGLARQQHARLVCVYVETAGLALAGSVAGVDAAIRDAKEDIAHELRESLEARAEALGLDAHFIERSGSPYAEIVRVATELHADAIVVGASTQSGHRVVGSVGTRLIRQAKWPVTVVP